MKSTAKATEKRSRTVVVLAIAVALMLLGSIFAQMFNTSFYKVKVSRISFDTDSGTLSGLLYLPKGVDASNPHPTIVTTHGYLNSAEMQDETAIEMSRRGYVVLALDMYDHGHSHGNADNTGGFFNFWPTSLWDAAQYMYSQDYVAKDAQGNGQIAVSGHSMGGFSSEMAIYLDEQNYAAAGYRIIKAGLSMGADYSWTSYLSLDEPSARSAASTTSSSLQPTSLPRRAAPSTTRTMLPPPLARPCWSRKFRRLTPGTPARTAASASFTSRVRSTPGTTSPPLPPRMPSSSTPLHLPTSPVWCRTLLPPARSGTGKKSLSWSLWWASCSCWHLLPCC